MKFILSDAVCSKFPSLSIGVLRCSKIQNAPSNDEIDALLKEQELRIRSQFSKETFSQDPKITAWRKAYADFGVKPKDAKSSIENLYRIILSGRDVRRISSLVDVYNLTSIKHMIPMGGEDLHAVVGDIILDVAGGAEPAVKLLGDEEAESPIPGEIIYKDDKGAICRRWNWREADRTKLTDATTDCILVSEGIDPVTKDHVRASIEELSELVKKHCNAQVVIHLLDSEKREVDL